MFAGHVAVALAARRVRDDLPLWSLVLAAQACDYVEWFARYFMTRPDASLYSHAYPFVVVAALIAAAAAWAWKRSLGASLLVLMLYLSHPPADYITGFKPLWWHGPMVGLHFVERPAEDFVIQGIVCIVGWAIYLGSLPPARRRQLVALTPLLFLLTLQSLSDLWVRWRIAAGETWSPFAENGGHTDDGPRVSVVLSLVRQPRTVLRHPVRDHYQFRPAAHVAHHHEALPIRAP